MSARTIAGRAALLLCGFLAAPCWGADEPTEPDISLSVGLNFSRGDFGTDAVIEDTVIPLGFTAVFERAAFIGRDRAIEVRIGGHNDSGDVGIMLLQFSQ